MKNYIITGLVVLIAVLLMFTCNQKPKVITKTFHQIDSTHTSDTIIKEVVKHHHHLKLDTVYIDSNDVNGNLSHYVFKVKDSLLSATITAKSETRPEIDFKYKLKQFQINDTIRIKETFTKEIVKNKLYFGSELIVKPMFTQVYLGVDFAEKNGHLFNLAGGYDLRTDEPVLKLGYKRLISRK